MSAVPDFRLYHGNALEVLAGLLAEELRLPAAGALPLEPDTILIPQPSMRRWLEATLAERHGIAANLRFLAPGEFVGEVLAANEAAPESIAAIDAGRLAWRLYAALHDADARAHAGIARALGAYLAGSDGEARLWPLAAGLADAFVKYQAWRRDWLVRWDRGAEPDDWQAELWRRATRGLRHRAAAIDAFLARFGRADAPAPAGLPARVFAFACLNVSPDVLRVLTAAARGATMHFYLPTPTRKYWGDLGSLRERSAGGDPDPFARAENPLLAAWGRAGREFIATLFSYDLVAPREIEAYAAPYSPSGLLQRMQRDLLERQPPSGPRLAIADLVERDRSLQIHACDTRLREVEVLHDQLRALIEDMPDLQARDIAVMAPDIDAYAPHVAAVFGAAQGTPRAIPYTIADGSTLAASPLAELVLRLVDLPDSRLGANEVVDLLALPPLMRRFGLDAESLDRLRHWIAEAGARWGLDAAHRARLGAPAEDAFTWRFALDRLLLGHAAGDDAPIAGVAPWPDLEGSALDALDALVRVLARLDRAIEDFARPHSAAEWQGALAALLDDLLPANLGDAAEERALARILAELEAFRAAADDAGFADPVPRALVREHLRARLAESDRRRPFLAGGVTFCRMVPMRLIPFRVICLVGMNDGEYPRRDPAAALNRLADVLDAGSRRRGDRSVRDDDRFLFLQLLTAAERVLYLSYIGRDAAEGTAREPSVLVSELLDAATEYFDDRDAARERLVLAHPLQPFGRAASEDPRRVAFDPLWRAALDAPSGTEALPAFAAAPLADEADVRAAIDIVALRRFLLDPSRAFLRQRLQFGIRDDDARLPEAEPYADANAIERAQLQRRVLDALRTEPDLDAGILCRRLKAEARLPPGAAGEERLRDLLRKARPIARAIEGARRGEPAPLAFSLPLGDTTLRGMLDDVDEAHALRAKPARMSGRDIVRWHLDALVLAALGDPRGVLAFADFADDGFGPRPLARHDPDRARAALAWLVALMQQGLSSPLPFAPGAGWRWCEVLGDAAGKNADDPHALAEAAATEYWLNRDGNGEGANAATRLALRGAMPFDDAAATRRFGRLAVAIFGALRDADVPETMP